MLASCLKRERTQPCWMLQLTTVHFIIIVRWASLVFSKASANNQCQHCSDDQQLHDGRSLLNLWSVYRILIDKCSSLYLNTRPSYSLISVWELSRKGPFIEKQEAVHASFTLSFNNSVRSVKQESFKAQHHTCIHYVDDVLIHNKKLQEAQFALIQEKQESYIHLLIDSTRARYAALIWPT